MKFCIAFIYVFMMFAFMANVAMVNSQTTCADRGAPALCSGFAKFCNVKEFDNVAKNNCAKTCKRC